METSNIEMIELSIFEISSGNIKTTTSAFPFKRKVDAIC